MASTAARPGIVLRTATAKKILIDSTSKLPRQDDRVCRKSARLSDEAEQKRVGERGRNNGQVTVRKTRPRVARRVCAASSRAGLTAVTRRAEA